MYFYVPNSVAAVWQPIFNEVNQASEDQHFCVTELPNMMIDAEVSTREDGGMVIDIYDRKVELSEAGQDAAMAVRNLLRWLDGYQAGTTDARHAEERRGREVY